MQNFFNDIKIQFLNYYDLGVELLPKIIFGFLFLIALRLVAFRIRKSVISGLEKRGNDPLTTSFIGKLLNAFTILVGLLIFLKIVGLGDIASGIMGTAGVGAFVIGFAFKDIGEHFLAGFILAFNRPFKVGDLVELGGEKGQVVCLNIRNTQVKTFDGRDTYIPNGNIIKNALTNYTIDGFIRKGFVLSVDYEVDINEVINLITDKLYEVKDILTDSKKPFVAISDLGPSAIKLSVYYWLNTFDKDVSSVSVQIEAVSLILSALKEKGIYIPTEIIEIKNHKESKLALEKAS